jgi:hypothetical protein
MDKSIVFMKLKIWKYEFKEGQVALVDLTSKKIYI